MTFAENVIVFFDMTSNSSLAITWLGHSTFLLRSPGGKNLLFDPWLFENPSCPAEWKRTVDPDLILVTHAHEDHFSDVELIARDTGAPVVAIVEICHFLETRGVRGVIPMNLGGMVTIFGVDIAMVRADHSSGRKGDRGMEYMGEAVGYLVRFEDGLTIYFAGDTDVYGDMRLIREQHQPDIAFLPIGDRFTMGPKGAALAAKLLGARQVVPMHYGTFPELTGTILRFRELIKPSGIDVLELQPGETSI